VQNPKDVERRARIKHVKNERNFYTSKSFIAFHLVHNLFFWAIVLPFPIFLVQGCQEGHDWFAHIAFGLFMLINLAFDIILLIQFIKRELLNNELRLYAKKDREKRLLIGKLAVIGEAILEIFLANIGLLDIYTDFAFITIAAAEPDLKIFFALSLTSFCFTILPKLYSYYLLLMVLFNGVAGEDKKKKFAFRAFIFTEFRVHALSVDYIAYEKHKTEFLMGTLKFSFEDLPQFIIQVFYLTSTTCGNKNSNEIVYLSLMVSVVSSYFGFLFRLILFVYLNKRLNSAKQKEEVSISNEILHNYGFKHIRRKLRSNDSL